jgi:hypothetical protein
MPAVPQAVGTRLDPKDGLPGFLAVEEAERLVERGEFARARDILEPFLQRDLNNPRLWHTMSKARTTREIRVDETASRTDGRLKGKDYERELARLHVELVKLQQWVVYKGIKICIVFEGRDGAGKGGVIKAITERVSPRVFRVVALPAPTEREKSQCTCSIYYAPTAGAVAISTGAGTSRRRRAGDGLLPTR